MLGVLNGFTLLLSVCFITYVLLIVIPYLRYPKVVPGNPDDFEWHFMVPCRDEEVVIAETIERARSTFPQAHVWVIDDDSDDLTLEIANSYAAHDSHVHVVSRKRPDARLGKGAALNAAYRQMIEWMPAGTDPEKVIVTVIDADGELAANALEVVASDSVFGDRENGAAQIAVWMKNRADKNPLPGKGRLANRFASLLLRAQDIEFRTTISAMQSLRTRTGTVGLGGNGQFTRLSVLNRINAQYGEPWHGSLLEDYELGVHIMLAGSKTKHVFDTHVSQEALPSVRRLLTQRSRWAQGNMDCIRYIPEIAKSIHVSSAGVLEALYYLLLPYLQVLGGLALVGLLGFNIAHAVTDPDALAIYVGNLWSNLILILLFAIAPFAMWGPIYRARCEPQISLWTSIGYGFMMWLYVYYMFIAVFRALYRTIFRKTGWAKTRRNAEVFVKGATTAVEH